MKYRYHIPIKKIVALTLPPSPYGILVSMYMLSNLDIQILNLKLAKTGRNLCSGITKNKSIIQICPKNMVTSLY